MPDNYPELTAESGLPDETGEERYDLDAREIIPPDAVTAEETALPPDDRVITVKPRTQGPEEAIPGMNPDAEKESK